MMSFCLIVLATFVLTIAGVHAWCSCTPSALRESRQPPWEKRRAAARHSIDRDRDHPLAPSRQLTGSAR
jgi:hypothetical protein